MWKITAWDVKLGIKKRHPCWGVWYCWVSCALLLELPPLCYLTVQLRRQSTVWQSKLWNTKVISLEDSHWESFFPVLAIVFVPWLYIYLFCWNLFFCIHFLLKYIACLFSLFNINTKVPRFESWSFPRRGDALQLFSMGFTFHNCSDASSWRNCLSSQEFKTKDHLFFFAFQS